MPVVFPPEVLKSLLARSPEEAGKPKRVTVKTAWERLREAVKAYRTGTGATPLENAFVTSLEDVAPDLRPRLTDAYEILKEEAPPSTLAVKTASVLCTYFSFRARGLDFSEALMGLPFAFEAYIDSLTYQVKWHKAGGFIAASDGFAELTLRERVLRSSKETREECHVIAKRLWPTANFMQRATLAYTFFEDEAWAHEIAKTFIEDTTTPPAKRLPIELLMAIVRDPDLMRAAIAKRQASRSFFEVVRTLGEASFDIIAEVFKAPRDPWDLQHAAMALAVFDDPRAAELLVSGLASSKVRPSIADYCARFPKTARASLEAVIAKGKKTSRVAKLANQLLATVAKTEASVESADGADGVDENDEPTTTSNEPAAEDASEDELPWILVSPPWLTRKKLKRRVRPSLANVAMAEREEHVHLTKEILRAAAEAVDARTPTFRLTDIEATTGANAVSLSRPRSNEDGSPSDVIEHIDDESLERQWSEVGMFSVTRERRPLHYVAYALVRLGTRAIAGLVKFFATRDSGYFRGDRGFLTSVDSPRLAPAVAKLFSIDGRGWDESWGPYGRRWLRTYPETAVIGLVPSTLNGGGGGGGGGGDEEKSSRASERALRFLRDDVGVDVMSIARSAYGEEVCAVLEEILAWDARFDLPDRISKLPAIYRPESMTRPLLKNGKRIPLAALDHLGTMLAFTDKRFPYPGIQDVKAVSDPRSLAELSWDLARAWEIGGAKGGTAWMMESLIHFADDEVVRRTTPAMRSQTVSDVLQRIGTDAAVMELVTIGARAEAGNQGYSWASTVVANRLRQIANERGVTAFELEDSVLPVREIDYKHFTLDYGSRVFKVGFDERLEVFIEGDDGERTRQLPAIRKTDDKKKVEAARQVWQDLKEEVSAVVARRLVHLERAMILGITWSPEELVRRYVAHPLLGHLGRTLLWEQNGKRFRITEDATYADVDDHEFELAPSAPVKLAHPGRLHLEDPAANEVEAARWVQTFFDYRIVQPFTQVGRTIRAISEDKRTQRVFQRTSGNIANLNVGRVDIQEFKKRLSDRGYVNDTKTLTRGEAWLKMSMAQHVLSIELSFLPTWLDFDPVDMAECISDMDA